MSSDPNPLASEKHDDETSAASSEEDQQEEETPVESLVVGRSKRATAGNRLSSILQQEADDDELELLFAEDGEEEDIEFEGDEGEDASDAQLDSSSDEEDQGPTQANDDLEGEKELQKQDRAERRKKRKAQETMTRHGPIRKKARISPTAAEAQSTTPVPRPKKKSERLHWLPAADEGPIRSSSRKQTVENKTIIHERMKKSEEQRIKQIGIMEAAAKRKEASKPKAMTQADRMAEAAKMEKKNAKSLNRWEETEKKRAEEQRAKLEALHNRQLSGPVITWWSGLARWVNGKLGQVGVKAIKDVEEAEGGLKMGSSKDVVPDQLTGGGPEGILNHNTTMVPEPEPEPEPLTSASQQPNHAEQSEQVEFTPPHRDFGFLDGIHFYASLPATTQQMREPSQIRKTPEPRSPPGNAKNLPPTKTDPKPPANIIEYSSRNLIRLENIDANALKIPELQNHILLKKRNGKPPSK